MEPVDFMKLSSYGVWDEIWLKISDRNMGVRLVEKKTSTSVFGLGLTG